MKIAVIGGGPAGLRAAEVAANGGASVTLFDAKPSVGRKLLVAGRGGLNLTKDEPPELFAGHYYSGDAESSRRWASLIADFDPAALRKWAGEMGIETFVASTRRVYPRDLKAAPLLRNWVRRLKSAGVEFAMNHRWQGLSVSNGRVELEFQAGRKIEADAAILALGGGSWPGTGSNGQWTAIMEGLGIAVEPLAPANCGWECRWPAEVLAAAEGRPLKNLSVSAGGSATEGELLVTKYGLEGGALYELGSVLRKAEKPVIHVDFKPGVAREKLLARMESVRNGFLEEARRRWHLSEAVAAILAYSDAAPFASVEALATSVKSFQINLIQPRPLAEAISSAGGVCWSELDPGLMLRKIPGVFVAGEMIDWEAPTGGYLLHGCFATATRAADAALQWCAVRAPQAPGPSWQNKSLGPLWLDDSAVGMDTRGHKRQ